MLIVTQRQDKDQPRIVAGTRTIGCKSLENHVQDPFRDKFRPVLLSR